MGKSALKLNKTAKRRYIWRTNIAIINLGYFIHRNVNIRKTGLILPNCLINLKLFPPTCEYFYTDKSVTFRNSVFAGIKYKTLILRLKMIAGGWKYTDT